MSRSNKVKQARKTFDEKTISRVKWEVRREKHEQNKARRKSA